MNKKLIVTALTAVLSLAACAPSAEKDTIQPTDRLIIGSFSGEFSNEVRGELVTALEDEGFKVLDAAVIKPPPGAAPYVVTGQSQFFRSTANGQPDTPPLIGSGLVRLTSLADGTTARRYEFGAPTYAQALSPRGYARRLAKDIGRDFLKRE
jgi:hypothetical protein